MLVSAFQHENTMKAAVLALVITWAALLPQTAAMAQTARAQRSEVSVIYGPPKDPAHQQIYEQLKEIGFLDKVGEFISPVQLPRTLLMKLEGCDGDANASYERDTIVICYEYIDELWKTVPEEMTETGVTPVDALAGPLLDTILHEVAHAMFDMLRVPVLGREEDAADQVAAYIMLRLGNAEARRLIAGAAYAYKTEAEAAETPPGLKQFAGAHGMPAQRLYNLLCLAYGADPQLFGDFVEKGYLPKERAEDCKDEYQQVAFAFQQLIGPYLDPALAKQVMDKTWLPDAKWNVQRRSGSQQPK
jgi:Putative metallopeptidase